MLALLSTLALTASVSEIPWREEVNLNGFLNDGSAAVFLVNSPEDFAPEGSLGLKIFVDREGHPTKAFRMGGGAPFRSAPESFRKLWSVATPDPDDDSLTSADFVDPVLVHEPLIEGQRLPGGATPLSFSVVSDHQRCPTRILVAQFGSVSGVVAVDACRKGEERSKEAGDYLTVGWSPQGDRAALAWNTVRIPAFAPGQHCPAVTEACEGISRGYMVIISRRTLASIDLLDAGAGKKLDALADKLEKARFRVGHRGKAETPRKSTEIYFAPGFEPEVKELTTLLGLPAGAAKPLTWKTPYSITVAAGER